MRKLLEYLALVLSVSGVVLNNNRSAWCFAVWLVSNGICLHLHYRARLRGLALRDLIFLALALVGWWQWTR